jgi:hypothetical protein
LTTGAASFKRLLGRIDPDVPKRGNEIGSRVGSEVFRLFMLDTMWFLHKALEIIDVDHVAIFCQAHTSQRHLVVCEASSEGFDPLIVETEGQVNGGFRVTQPLHRICPLREDAPKDDFD